MTLNPNKDLDFSYLTPAKVRRDAKRDAVHDRLIQSLIADAKARGVVALRCDECGYDRHSLHRIGQGCNAPHPYLDGETCDGWNLSEVFSKQ